jgi:AraC-like DNA-binding protein
MNEDLSPVKERIGHTHTAPVAVILPMLDLVQRWDVRPSELLAATSLSRTDVEDPLGRLEFPTIVRLFENARALTGEPGLGYYLALQKRVSMFGYIGFVAQSARTIGEVLTLALQYAPLVSCALTFELRLDGRAGWLIVDERAPLGSVRDVILISIMLGLQTIRASLTGSTGRQPLELAFPEPPYYPRFAHIAPHTAFGQPLNRIAVDRATLDLPIVTADPTALRVARQVCEQAIEELGFDTEFVHQVRRALPRSDGGFRNIDEVAALLRTSSRTLKRRLALEDVSYSALLDRERKVAAVRLLRRTRLGLDAVAQRLDYASVSPFIRAFQRWTGETPSAYRRAARRLR